MIYLVPVFPQAYESVFPPSPPAALLGTEPETEIFICKFPEASFKILFPAKVCICINSMSFFAVETFEKKDQYGI